MSDESLLQDIREDFQRDTEDLRDQREEGQTDIKYVALDPWPPEDREQRIANGRPCLTFDEIGQYTNQSVNDMLANKRAIQVTARGPGANDQTAEFRQNKIREIEYRSNAQEAYATLFANIVERSYGALRVKTDYVSGQTFDQDIWIEPIVNPDLVTPDCYAIRVDGSDMTHCTIAEWRSKAEFIKQFGKDAKITDFPTELERSASQWIEKDRIQLAEHWRISDQTRTLLLVQPPAPQNAPLSIRPQAAPKPLEVWADDFLKQKLSGTVIRKREVKIPKVTAYLTNGVEILKTTPWVGRYIPIVLGFGKVIYVEESGRVKRVVQSMVRGMRAPAMMYNYIRTCQAELIGMTPKVPYFFYEGQLSPEQEQLLAASLHIPVASIKVKPTVDGLPVTQLLPIPQRQVYEPAIQALELAAEACRRAIQAAAGISPLPTEAQRRNQKSGVALQQIESSGQKGSYHFVDHYKQSVRFTGLIINDLMDHILDTARDVAVRTPKDETQMVRINDETAPQPILMQAGHEHEVTVSDGPSYESERARADDFADQLAQNQYVFPRIADLVIKLKDLGPIGDEIADRLTPPEYKQQQGMPNDPNQLKQALSQAQAQLQQLGQQGQQMAMELKTEAAKQQAQIQKAQIDAQKDIQLQIMRDATSIRVAQINASVKGVVSANEQLDEALALARQQAHDAAVLTKTQGHEAVQAHLDRQHEIGMAVLDHAATQAQGAQEHDQALQQIDAQPEPAAPTNGNGQ